MEYMIWVWVAIIGASLIVEFFTFSLTSIWFALAGVLALILEVCGVEWHFQLICFIVAALLLLIFVRNLAKRFLIKTDEKTNVDAFAGKRVRMLTETDFDTMGTIKVNGVEWSAIEQNRETIGAGILVEIVKVEGNKVIVKKLADEKEGKEPAKEEVAKAAKPAKTETTKTTKTTTKLSSKK